MVSHPVITSKIPKGVNLSLIPISLIGRFARLYDSVRYPLLNEIAQINFRLGVNRYS